METYSYIAELVVLPIIFIIITSLRSDCYVQSAHYRYLKTMYYLALFSSIVTFSTCFFNAPLKGHWDIFWGYVVDTMYFIFVPSVAVMYAVYVQLTANGMFHKSTIWKRGALLLTPYAIYILFVIANLQTGLVFTMTKETGYTRGPLFEIPYPLVTFYGILVIIAIVRNFKFIPREFSCVILATAITALFITLVLFYEQHIILTGLLSTTCILSIHLHTLHNANKEDLLTGAQTRLALLNELEKEIETSKRFSLYVISLRGMKHVNEQYGLHIGDKKLSNIAEILLRHVRRERVFRYSGDEFAVLLPYFEGDMSPVMHNIMEDFSLFTEIEENSLPIEVSTIRVDYPIFGTHVGDLVAVIDYGIHLLKEKKGSGNKYLHDQSTADTMKKYHATIHELNSAIAAQRFVVHYQPIYHAPTETFTQAEALIRMEKADGTLIYPNDFIEVANDTGIIVEMTYQMLEQVCRDFRALLTKQPDTTLQAISVNVPYLVFVEDDMQDRFVEILGKYDILPSQIKIEVTERVVVEDFALMDEKMKQLMKCGFEFELDDFGVGYSNLQMSITFPMEVVKLDRSILLTALATETGCSFFQHIMMGLNTTGRKTLAEGVETQEQLSWAKASNCEYIQGYFFSKPICFGKFSEFLEK